MRVSRESAVSLLLALALCFLLGGCAGEKPPTQSDPVMESGTETAQPQPSGKPTDKPNEVEDPPAPDEREAARGAYLDFLSGIGTVTTSQAFRPEDENYHWFSPDYGTYSYEELKYAVSDVMMGDGSPRYTFLDLGGDREAELLVLRFENEDPSFYNWTGVIRYDDGKLTLTYSYEDGYRVWGELFTSGFLCIGGSGGAGEYDESGFLFEADGTARELYQSSDLWGGFAPYIRYQLEDPPSGLTDEKYYDLSPAFCVSTCINQDGLTVYVEYSDDTSPEARALEDAFVKELTDHGIQPVDWDTFAASFNLGSAEYRAQSVDWTEFDDGLSPYFDPEVTACYPDEWWYACNPDYEEVVLDDTEYAVWVAVEVTKPVTDLQVVSLELSDYTDYGPIYFTEELFYLPELTPEKPLLLALSFPGDLPSFGVKYLDPFWNTRLFTFCQSGLDGSLILEEAGWV